MPAVAQAQQKPQDKATVNKVIPPADAALSALNAVLAASNVASDDRINIVSIRTPLSLSPLLVSVESHRLASSSNHYSRSDLTS